MDYSHQDVMLVSIAVLTVQNIGATKLDNKKEPI